MSTFSKDEFFDIFQQSGDVIEEKPTNFTMSPTEDSDIFKNTEKEPEVITSEVKEEVKEDTETDSDIFIHDEDKAKLGRKPKYNFQDASGYFEDRVKAGKYVGIALDDKGTPFIPTKPEEFDEFFDFQLNHKLAEKEKEVQENWYSSKTPAWQAVAEFAEKVRHPSELLPFIQGVQNVDDLNEVDETTVEGAEQIYRVWLNKRGEPSDVIEQQLELAKAGGDEKFLKLASKYKPILVEQEIQRLSDLDKAEEQRSLEYQRIISDNQIKAIEAIEAPIFGKQKLKDEEKSIVFNMIGLPKKELGGYAVYTEIDKLYQNKDFATLREVALLLAKKDSYLKYAANNTAQDVATGLQRQLRVANTKSTTGNDEPTEQDQPVRVQRNQYNSSNNFGFRRTG